ncbi:hypothetical protein Tcan_12687 [Toxocara canis]|uniref:Uncharacterized protein n=1 Tax=Toxocara canis TaxID=6265 RepID=A0A0B2V2V3_TOXCA|nr:hypothetical protein Tcan_12687 [Toxocara canis]
MTKPTFADSIKIHDPNRTTIPIATGLQTNFVDANGRPMQNVVILKKNKQIIPTSGRGVVHSVTRVSVSDDDQEPVIIRFGGVNSRK